MSLAIQPSHEYSMISMSSAKNTLTKVTTTTRFFSLFLQTYSNNCRLVLHPIFYQIATPTQNCHDFFYIYDIVGGIK